MHDHEPRGQSFFALLPAFTTGVEDGINPCGIAGAVLFIMYLSAVGCTRRRVFLIGALFILSAVITHVMVSIGYWDRVLASSPVQQAMRGIYLLLGIVFLMLGVLNISDWWRYKKRSHIGCFTIKLPVFFRDCEESPTVSRVRKTAGVVGLALVTIFMGGVVTLLGTIYPQREYIFIVHSFWMAGGGQRFAYWSFFLYSIAMTLPLIMGWFIVLWLIFKGNKNPGAIVYYKGISAAVFLSTGIGLGYFFLK